MREKEKGKMIAVKREKIQMWMIIDKAIQCDALTRSLSVQAALLYPAYIIRSIMSSGLCWYGVG